jgi:protein-tyrosine phosphatase
MDAMQPVLYWVLNGPEQRLAIMARPRGEDWLEDELQALWAGEFGTIVSLLTDAEMQDVGLAREPAVCASLGIGFVAFPIADRGTPGSIDELRHLVHEIQERLRAGQPVAIHCRAGIGRSALVAACVLIEAGMESDEALGHIAAARGVPVPDTEQQRSWVEDYARARALEQLRRAWE